MGKRGDSWGTVSAEKIFYIEIFVQRSIKIQKKNTKIKKSRYHISKMDLMIRTNYYVTTCVNLNQIENQLRKQS